MNMAAHLTSFSAMHSPEATADIASAGEARTYLPETLILPMNQTDLLLRSSEEGTADTSEVDRSVDTAAHLVQQSESCAMPLPMAAAEIAFAIEENTLSTHTSARAEEA